MRLIFRKRRPPLPPPRPKELTLTINRWIDGKKRRLADALSRREQRMTLSQKKWALTLFCSLTAGLFLFNLYHGLVLHRSTNHSPAGYIHMPAELPFQVPPSKKLPRSPSDTTGRLAPIDSIH